MTTLLDDLPEAPVEHTAFAQRLRNEMAAVRVSFVWLGVRKTLTAEQREQAADTFGAERTFLSAGKKLLDTSHPAFKAVTSIRTRIKSYWEGNSLPFPEAGIRLVRRESIASLVVTLQSLQQELAETVQFLEESYDQLKQAARRRLGSLFNGADYPANLRSWFGVSWDFPTLEPPSYLQQLSPQLYREEAARVTARFDAAVTLAEQAFTEELSRLVSHLTERLSGSEDGKPKVFRDTAIDNLREFFSRFRDLNIHSSPQLDELVQQAQRVVGGVQPQTLRTDAPLRQQVAGQLSGLQAVLDGLLVDRPRRKILRRGLSGVTDATLD